MATEDYTLCVLGCGTMGVAIISGILDSIVHPGIKHLNNGQSASGTSTPLPIANLTHRMPNKFIACVKRDESARNLRKTLDPNLVTVLCRQNIQGAIAADLILLGAKPNMIKEILTESGMKEALEGKLLISIATGVTIAQMREWCPESTHIVRAMPNVPCKKIREGMTVLVTEPTITEEERSVVQWIFSQIGRAMFLEEKHIDVATALCGSGPAFACVVLEAMVDGGVMMGIPRAEAQVLVAQTMQGAARMVLDGQHPAIIRNAVATPGGCTIGGLLTMEDGKIRSTMARTIQEATNVASGLGKTQR